MQTEKPPVSSYEPFHIKEKIGDMIKYGRPLTMQFSRRNRDLADEIRRTMTHMYHLAVELEKKYYRKTTTQELDVELEWLRHLVRMAADKECCGPYLRCLIRGGNWNNGANAGVFNSNLNNPRSNSNVNVGGRSAFRPKR